MIIRILLLATLLAVPLAAAAAETHPFSIHDMLAMDRISDPNVSPSGDRIVFSVRTTDLEANRGRTDLWLVGADGSGLQRLTTHPAGEWNPRWSPDGRTVFFLSSRGGSAQVWRIAVDGGEARPVTEFPLVVTSLAVSPDGSKLAVSMDVFPNCDSIDCTVEKLEEENNRKSSGRVYERLFIRHWDTWKDGRRSHLFVVPVEGGDPVDVMTGMDADCPTKPFGGPEEYTFSRDGKALVFTARDVGAEEAWSTDFDLYRTPVDGSAEPTCLTESNAAWDTQPVFSPDGATMAYLAMTRAGYESDRFRVVLMDWPGGASRVLTESWDRSPGSIVWSSDGKTLYANAANLGQRSLFAVDVGSGEVRTVVEQGTVRSFAEVGGRVVYSADNLRSPVEIYSVRPDGSDVRNVTRLNEEKIDAARMGEPEQFTFKGWKGETVHAYVVKPVDFDPDRRYPVAFLIHGGPQGSFGNDFHYRWNPQAYTGAGYAVVMVDFHG